MQPYRTNPHPGMGSKRGQGGGVGITIPPELINNPASSAMMFYV